MPVPSTPQDLITLIREKLYDNTSGIIEEDTLRNVLENIINVLDAKFSFFSPTLTEEQYAQWNLMLDYMLRETKGVLTTSSTAPTGTTAKGKYLLSDIGTYTNLGGIVTTTGKLNYAYFDGTTWKLIEVDVPDNPAKSPQWVAGTYEEGALTYNNGLSYRANKTTTQEPSENASDWDSLGNKEFEVVESSKYIFTISHEGEVYAGIDKQGKFHFLESDKKVAETTNIKSRITTAENNIELNKQDIITLQEVIGNIGTEAVKVIENNTWLFAISFENEIYAGLKKDGKFYANIESNSVVAKKTWVNWGDSLTAGAGGSQTRNKATVLAKLLEMGYNLSALANINIDVSYSQVLEILVANSHNVVNNGVGGETINSIGARQGAWNAVASNDFILPQTTSTVEIANSTLGFLTSDYDGQKVQVLAQGSPTMVNPVTVEGIECTLSATVVNSDVTNYFIRRNVAGTRDVTIPKGTPIIMAGAKLYRNTDIAVVFCYQNGGYSSTVDSVTKISKIVENIGTPKFIVVGLHTGDAVSRLEQETALTQRFGNKFFNWRRYVSTNALYDFGITPTTDADFTAEQLSGGAKSDVYQMSVGALPSSFWSTLIGVADPSTPTVIPTNNDNIHLNAAGYLILGYKLYERAKNLGYIN